jgi:Fur family ferric uptake transcriptional regulator
MPHTPPPCGRPLPAPAPAQKKDHAEWKKQLKAHLEANGLKQSDQRTAIAEVVLGGFQGHFSTQDVVRVVQKKHPGIGAATVYRNIKTLVEAGLVTETLLDDQGRTVFELSDGSDDHHDHIICADCGAILEFVEPKIEELQEKITQSLSFTPLHHRHVIYARCDYKK